MKQLTRSIFDALVIGLAGVTVLTLAVAAFLASPMFLLTYALAYVTGDKSVR